MKTIAKNEVYQRVEDSEADLKVRSGWKFVPKSEWKKFVRDISKVEKVAKVDTSENSNQVKKPYIKEKRS